MRVIPSTHHLPIPASPVRRPVTSVPSEPSMARAALTRSLGSVLGRRHLVCRMSLLLEIGGDPQDSRVGSGCETAAELIILDIDVDGLDGTDHLAAMNAVAAAAHAAAPHRP